MSKVKQWAEDTAEKSVDNILKFFKNGTIDLNETKKFFNLGPKNNWKDLLPDQIRLEIEKKLSI